MKKIQRVSQSVKWFCIVLFIGMIIAEIINWIDWSKNAKCHAFNVYAQASLEWRASSFLQENSLADCLSRSDILTLSYIQRYQGFLISILPLSIKLTLIYFLAKLCSLYEKKHIFTAQNVRYLRYIGYAALAIQLCQPVYQALLIAVLSHYQRIGFSVSTMNILAILIALAINFIAWIMGEAHKMQQEQQYTV